MEIPAKQPHLLVYIIFLCLPTWTFEIPWNAKLSLSFLCEVEKHIFVTKGKFF